MITLNNSSLLKTYLLDNASRSDNPGNSSSNSSNNDKQVDVTNPFNGEVVGRVPSCTKEEVEQAVVNANSVQASWAAKTAAARSDLLLQWADLIDANLDDLAVIMTLEQGKPLKESRGEIHYANSFIRWFAEEGKRVYGDVIAAPKATQRITVLKQPVGICAAITPWNFPAAMLTRKVAPALAAGCTIIVKPAMQTPLSALALQELAHEAGIPKGVLQVLTGDAAMVGDVFTQDARIKKLSFTGSTAVGRTLMAQCANTLKKLSLELGGNAPFIVFADADLDKAAEGLIAAKYRNAGQTCVCANRIYIQDSIKEQFLAIYLQKVAALKVGDGLLDAVDIGPLINDEAVKKVTGLLKDAVDKGANLLTGGDINPVSKRTFNPTVISDVTTDMDIAHEEIFGPITAIATFSSESEVIAKANDTIYGLAAYFYTNDLARSWRVSEALEYGMVGQNTGLISTAVAPFGGIKQSGFGREGSKYGIEEYLTVKYWCQDIG